MKKPSPSLSHDEIFAALENAYAQVHGIERRQADAIVHVYRYSTKRDREVAAFFSALLAYGNVKMIQRSVATVLEPFGPRPARWLRDESENFDWQGFRHRFTTGEDIQIVAHWLRSALRSHDSLENFFCDQPDLKRPMRDLLSNFVLRFTGQTLPRRLQAVRQRRERNLKYLISDPLRGSACKRLNMFLRWVVRGPDPVDLGLWKRIRPGQLMLPVDTHLLKTLQLLAWTQSPNANWKVVEAATEKLRLFAPDDPIRYDFALCHLSMMGGSLATLE